MAAGGGFDAGIEHLFRRGVCMRNVFSAFLVLLSLLIAGPSLAQTATAPPPEKLSELLKLLDDPAIRSWITAQQQPQAQAPAIPTQDVEDLEEKARSHFAALAAAVPKVPSEIARVSARIRSEAAASGFAPTYLLIAAIVAVGLAIEWIFKRVSKGARFESGILNKLLLEAGPTLVFIVTASVIFLVVPWPPLVRPVVLFSLLAVFAFRTVLAIARLAVTAGASHRTVHRRVEGRYHFAGFLHRGDERDQPSLEAQVRELDQQRVAHGLGTDAGAV